MDERPPSCEQSQLSKQIGENRVMTSKLYRGILFALVCGTLFLTSGRLASAQTQPQRDDDTNVDTQLYLIMGTNRDVDEGKMPINLEPAMKRLRETLNFKHFSVAATFLNRVKNGGTLDVSWVGGPFLATVPSAVGNPSFNQFTAMVKLVADDAGRPIVRLQGFRFGSRVPIIVGQRNTSPASTNADFFPVVNYETIGLRTDISMREGESVVAGTMNVGPSGDAIIVVIAGKRSAN